MMPLVVLILGAVALTHAKLSPEIKVAQELSKTSDAAIKFSKHISATSPFGKRLQHEVRRLKARRLNGGGDMICEWKSGGCGLGLVAMAEHFKRSSNGSWGKSMADDATTCMALIDSGTCSANAKCVWDSGMGSGCYPELDFIGELITANMKSTFGNTKCGWVGKMVADAMGCEGATSEEACGPVGGCEWGSHMDALEGATDVRSKVRAQVQSTVAVCSLLCVLQAST